MSSADSSEPKIDLATGLKVKSPRSSQSASSGRRSRRASQDVAGDAPPGAPQGPPRTKFISALRAKLLFVTEVQTDDSEIKEAFDTLAGDKTISLNEALSQMFYNPKLLTKYFGSADFLEVKRAFKKTFDADGDGEITWGEFKKAAASASEGTKVEINIAECLQTSPAALKTLFKRIDKNGDGISKTELYNFIFEDKEALKKYFGGAAAQELKAAFQRMNTAKSVESISWDEFQAGAAAASETAEVEASLADQLNTAEGRQALKVFFDRIDKNGDGVTKRELYTHVFEEKEAVEKYFASADHRVLKKMFDSINTKKTVETISWEEFKVGTARAAAAAPLHTKMATAMKEDADAFRSDFDKIAGSDGVVSLGDLYTAVFMNKALLGKYFEGEERSQFKEAFKSYDCNNDGDLTFKEFQDGVRQAAEASQGVQKLGEALAGGEDELKAAFEAIDKNGNGISKTELKYAIFDNKALLEQYFGAFKTAQELMEVFDQMNTTTEQVLSWREFVAGIESAAAAAAAEAKLAEAAKADAGLADLKAAFSKIDRDNNGITKKELFEFIFEDPALLEKYFGSARARELARVFDRMNTSNAVEVVSWKEFESSFS